MTEYTNKYIALEKSISDLTADYKEALVRHKEKNIVDVKDLQEEQEEFLMKFDLKHEEDIAMAKQIYNKDVANLRNVYYVDNRMESIEDNNENWFESIKYSAERAKIYKEYLRQRNVKGNVVRLNYSTEYSKVLTKFDNEFYPKRNKLYSKLVLAEKKKLDAVAKANQVAQQPLHNEIKKRYAAYVAKTRANHAEFTKKYQEDYRIYAYKENRKDHRLYIKELNAERRKRAIHDYNVRIGKKSNKVTKYLSDQQVLTKYYARIAENRKQYQAKYRAHLLERNKKNAIALKAYYAERGALYKKLAILRVTLGKKYYAQRALYYKAIHAFNRETSAIRNKYMAVWRAKWYAAYRKQTAEINAKLNKLAAEYRAKYKKDQSQY